MHLIWHGSLDQPKDLLSIDSLESHTVASPKTAPGAVARDVIQLLRFFSTS